MTSCHVCNTCNYSYKVPTDQDAVIYITCDTCGATWGEPNELYLKAQKKKLEDDYFSQFDQGG